MQIKYLCIYPQKYLGKIEQSDEKVIAVLSRRSSHNAFYDMLHFYQNLTAREGAGFRVWFHIFQKLFTTSARRCGSIMPESRFSSLFLLSPAPLMPRRIPRISRRRRTVNIDQIIQPAPDSARNQGHVFFAAGRSRANISAKG